MERETWKTIREYPEYSVSTFGRVKNSQGKVMSPIDNGFGYKKISLSNDHSKRKMYIHRLVAEAFLENPEHKPCVNHLDNDPGNNRASNLEWCTKKENSEWMVKQRRNIRTSQWKERQDAAREKYEKAVIAKNRETGETKVFRSVNSTKAHGFSPGLVSMCCNGKAKTHKGFVFAFITDEERRNAKHHSA